MEKKIELRLFIGTPAYNSMVHTDYMHSLISYHDSKIPFTVMTIGNESLICRGRNTIISYFYTGINYTNLLFLDADIHFHAEGLIRLISHQKDVIGVPVPLKGFDAKGNPVYNTGKVLGEEKSGLLKMDKIGTAIFMLSRKAVSALVTWASENNHVYWPNPHSKGNTQPDIKMYDIFQTGVTDGEYDSEDYFVCRILRKLGFDIYVDPSIPCKHNGMVEFT